MNYSEFVNAMQSKVREQMEPEVKVETHTAVKNNGTHRIGLVLMQRGVNMSPTIYLEEFYEQYQNGTDISELAQMIQNLYQRIYLYQIMQFYLLLHSYLGFEPNQHIVFRVLGINLELQHL